MTFLIFLILVVIVASGFFSGIEAALFAVSQSRALTLQEQKVSGATALAKIKENMSPAIIVIVIFTNISNIVGSMFVGIVAAKVLESAYLGFVSAIFTILIIIFSEILPKTIGENYAEKISLFMAPILLFSIKIMKPLVWLFEQLTKRFVQKKKIVSEEELKMLSQLGHLEGSIEEDEHELIQKVFTLNDLTAKDIMTPRTVISAFQKNKTIGEIRQQIYDLNNSRIPIFVDSIDQIEGLCFRKKILVALAKGDSEKKVEEFMQAILYVHESMKVDDLLQLFLQRKEQIAIVKDEFEGTSGLVTLEDVMEQLVGEIVDEEDEFVDTRVQAQQETLASGLVVEESAEK